MAPGPIYTQTFFTLSARRRGCYLITNEVTRALEKDLSTVKCGLLHLFVQHTSCALSLNENYDETVRGDMTESLNRIVPEDKGAFSRLL